MINRQPSHRASALISHAPSFIAPIGNAEAYINCWIAVNPIDISQLIQRHAVSMVNIPRQRERPNQRPSNSCRIVPRQVHDAIGRRQERGEIENVDAGVVADLIVVRSLRHPVEDEVVVAAVRACWAGQSGEVGDAVGLVGDVASLGDGEYVSGIGGDFGGSVLVKGVVGYGIYFGGEGAACCCGR